MGAGQSVNHSASPVRALHVLRVTATSPASHTNIEPFFDFIVGFDGNTLSSRHSLDISELETIVESHEGKHLGLMVWNSKNKTTREVPIVPSRNWALPASQPHSEDDSAASTKPSLLGLTMRVCEPELALDNVWHVLEITEGSPAESAGLVPYGDWIIGWSGGVLSAEGDFYDLVEAHVDKPLSVYVYSHDFDALREVVLVPNRHWGGDGLLGCVFGFGLLHRIPPRDAEQQLGVTTPPELLYYEYDSQTLFVPADQDRAGDAAHETGWKGDQSFTNILSPSSLDTPRGFHAPADDATLAPQRQGTSPTASESEDYLATPSPSASIPTFLGPSSGHGLSPRFNGSGVPSFRSSPGDATPRRTGSSAALSREAQEEAEEDTSASETDASAPRSSSRGSLTSID